MDGTGRAPKNRASQSSVNTDAPLYFRRCHHCGVLNQGDGKTVDRCHSCRRSLAPFHYFDERLIPTISDRHLRPPFLKNSFVPIQGLTVYWEGQ